MPRIRTIKPEYWTDDKIVDLPDPLTKLLFIGMWNFADDDGYIEASVRRLKRLIFPDNNYDVEKAVRALIAAGMVGEYDSDQGFLLKIERFRDHQKPQHPTPTKYTGITRNSRNPHEDSRKAHEPSPCSVVEGSVVVASPEATEEQFQNAYNHWPKKTERAKALAKFKRLAATRGTATLTADIIRFGDAYARTTEKQFVPALVVWLNGERWEDELPGTGVRKVNPERPPAPEGRRYAVDVASGVSW